LKAKNITIPDGSTILLVVNDNYPSTPVTDVNQLEYHILSGVTLIQDFVLDTPLQSSNGNTFKVIKYETDYYINGFSLVKVSNVQLKNSVVHVISDLLVIPAPASNNCTTCYKLINIGADISTSSSPYQYMSQLIQNVDFTITPPYTLLAIEDSAFDYGLFSSLQKNPRDRDFFVKQNIISGSVFPVEGSYPFAYITALDGTKYNITYYSSTSIILQNGNISYPLTAYPRSDGVYYDVYLPLVNFVPPPPVPPGSQPSSAVSIGVSLVFLILSWLSFFVLI